MKFFLVIYFQIFSTLCYSQYDVSGIISDKNSKEKLPGANVYIHEIKKGTITNENGEYKIENLSNGNYQIQFSYIGYKTEIIKMIISGKNILLNAELIENVIESHEVVISGGYTSYQDENALKIDVIKAEDLQSNGGINVTENLKYLPGLDIVSTGVSVGKPAIRGLSGNRVLIVKNGIREETQQWGDEHGLSEDEMGLERIEVIKGPASMLYGSDAMGGVLHFIEEKPASQGEINSDFTMKIHSNTAGFQNNFGVKGANKGFYWGFRAGHQNHADFITGDNKEVIGSRFRDYHAKGNLGFYTKLGLTRLFYSINNFKTGIIENTDSVFHRERKIISPYQDVNHQIVTLQNMFKLKNTNLDVHFSHQNNIRKEFEKENEETIKALQLNLNSENLDLRWNIPIDSNFENITGFQGMYQQNANKGEEILIPDAETFDLGIFNLLKWNYKKLTLLGGVRYDQRNIFTKETDKSDSANYRESLNIKYKNVSGSTGLSYSLNDKLIFRGNIASGFRSPNTAELTSKGVHEGTNRFEIGEKNLNKETNLEYDLSGHYHSDHISLEIAGFYNYINQYIYLQPSDSFTSDGIKIFHFKQDNAVFQGFEFLSDIHPHPLDWLHFETGFSIISAHKENKSNLPLIPAKKITQDIHLEKNAFYFLNNLSFFIRFLYNLPQYSVADYELPSNEFLIVNTGISGKKNLKNYTIITDFNITNLFDKPYYEHLSRLKNAGIMNIGRNVNISLRILFSKS